MSDRVLEIPIIELWGVLLVPLQGDVSDSQAASLVDRVLQRIRRNETRGLVLDLSGLWVVDSHLCSSFTNLAAAAQLMGTRTMLSGLNPDIAMTLQSMGVEFAGIETMMSLEHALASLGLRPARVAAAKNDPARESRGLMDQMLSRNPPVHE